MNRFIGIVSIFIFSSTQLLASTFQISKLRQEEVKSLRERYDNVLIKYDETTDEIIIDEALERELRESGILQTQDVKKGTACTGDDQ